MKDIAIYGAGGLGREIACLIRMINRKQKGWNIIGFFDDGLKQGTVNEYGTIIGGITELNTYKKPLSVVVAIGNAKTLATVVQNISNPILEFPNIIAPDVVIYDEDNLTMGKGNIFGIGSLISCNTTFGDFNILNNNVAVGHDTRIGSFNIFNPSVKISGEIEIGDRNFFGVGSIVLQQLEIGNDVTLGANSTMIRKAKDNCVYIGTPATLLM